MHEYAAQSTATSSSARGKEGSARAARGKADMGMLFCHFWNVACARKQMD